MRAFGTAVRAVGRIAGRASTPASRVPVPKICEGYHSHNLAHKEDLFRALAHPWACRPDIAQATSTTRGERGVNRSPNNSQQFYDSMHEYGFRTPTQLFVTELPLRITPAYAPSEWRNRIEEEDMTTPGTIIPPMDGPRIPLSPFSEEPSPSPLDPAEAPGAGIDAPAPMEMMPQRTYQPNTWKRKKKHGFLARLKKDPRVLKRRKAKGRWRTTMVG